jgi:hypothetical protein
VTWLNSDWSEWTSYSYTTAQITSLESRFLRQLDFKLYISPTDYHNFVSYLEFRLHARQLLGDVLLLSYRDMDVLSQSLTPAYVERLQLKIRPFEAMVLLAKQATSILVVYAATLVALASAGYVLSQYTVTLQKDEIAMMILSGLDLMNQQQKISVGNHQLIPI